MTIFLIFCNTGYLMSFCYCPSDILLLRASRLRVAKLGPLFSVWPTSLILEWAAMYTEYGGALYRVERLTDRFS
jgi:hypothetical protein